MKFGKVLLAGGVAAAMAATAVLAANEPQVLRQELMKKNGAAVGALVAIAKGEKPYDAETIKASLTTVAEVGKAFPDMFPAGSETGFETEAKPAIWEKMDDFKARAMKLSTDAETLLAQLPADQAGVGAALKTLGANCAGCHENYRVKKQ